MGSKGHGSAEDIIQEELWSHGIHALAGAMGRQRPWVSGRHGSAGATPQPESVSSGCGRRGRAPDHEAAEAAAVGTAEVNESRRNSRERFVRAHTWESRKEWVGFRGGWIRAWGVPIRMKPPSLPSASTWAVGGSEARSGPR